MRRADILEMAEQYFFVAMKNGWVAGIKGEDVSGMPGYKKIDFAIGDFRILDCWCVSDAGSAGTIIIWFMWPTHAPKPIWVMNYGGGLYRKEDVPFLKRALMVAYERKEFSGGRGPVRYEETAGGLIYSNRIEANTFEGFRGEENLYKPEGVRDLNPIRVGWHECWGMALI